jgi:hypothetical protein
MAAKELTCVIPSHRGPTLCAVHISISEELVEVPDLMVFGLGPTLGAECYMLGETER